MQTQVGYIKDMPRYTFKLKKTVTGIYMNKVKKQ